MNRLALALGLFAALLTCSACKKQQSDNDAIRAEIMQHLTGVGTLNMSPMVMDIRSVSINGNQAHAMFLATVDQLSNFLRTWFQSRSLETLCDLNSKTSCEVM